ncbi:MAG: peptide deformylase [Planctomycetales bacterium]|jgi:peptide deformylase|nr:peptide deformylase [Planctomycetales bacterium]
MEVVPFPHPALRYESKPIKAIDPDLERVVAEMFDLMYAAKGIGLAANQVALPYRLFIMNLAGDAAEKTEELVFINPRFLRRKGTAEAEEGCLSFPGLYGQVKRSAKVTIEAFNLKGECFEYALDELAGRAVQHEADHLDGVLFIDRMVDEDRRAKAGIVADYEAQFRRWQADGRYPSDDEIRRQLKALEPQ